MVLTTLGDDFVSLLSKRTGRQIINAGSNGDTTASALARLDKDVLSQDPELSLFFSAAMTLCGRLRWRRLLKISGL